jgi:hypothetical protein
MFASGASRFILRLQVPTLSQVPFWDRFLVPASRVCDPLLRKIGSGGQSSSYGNADEQCGPYLDGIGRGDSREPAVSLLTEGV